MNHKTTLVLLALVVTGGIFGLAFDRWPTRTPANDTLVILETKLTPDAIKSIDVAHGDHHLKLERGGDGTWSLPGTWPARQTEAQQLVDLLGGLHSRFTPIRTDAATDLKTYGLEPPAATVTVSADDGDHVLLFGEEPGDSNRFARATFLRIEGKSDVIRLAPGIVAMLTRPIDFYLRHQLFPGEKVKDDPTAGERLVAHDLAVTFKEGTQENSYALTQVGDVWQMKQPVTDAVDPEKLKSVLGAIPDLWVEKFVDESGKNLEKYGLKAPARGITVTRKGATPTRLLLGNLSEREEVHVIKAPPSQFGQPPMPPQTTIERFRYAKLENNDRVFEVKDGKLNNVFVAADTLRDPKLSRFTSFDAKGLEITRDGKTIVLEKDASNNWQVKKPAESEAEFSSVNDLLDKLAGLEARGKTEIIDGAKDEEYGLKPPAATLTVTVEESKGADDDKKKKVKKTFTFLVGKHDEAKKKLYVKSGQWPRINVVDDALDKLVKRPALAYKGRRVLDFTSSDLAALEVRHNNNKFRLEKDKEGWKLTAPEPAPADGDKANKLVSELAGLTAVEYVTEAAKPDDLGKVYGLDKPSLTAEVTYSKVKDGKPKKQKLLVGKQRGDKPEFFARLESAPEIFAVKKDIVDALDKGSLALLPQDLWNLPPGDLVELRVQKDGHETHLKHEGPDWRILAPFEAKALPAFVDPILAGLATLHSERYEALAAKDLVKYGLDKPYLRVVLTPKSEAPAPKPGEKEKPPKETEKDPKEKEKTSERIVLIGKPTREGEKTRFAKLGNGEAVFVVTEKFVAAAEYNPLELLDRLVLALDAKQVTSVKITSGKDSMALERKGEDWALSSPQASFAADRDVMASILAYWGGLRADKYVAYGPKVDLAKYGLDKPEITITITATLPGAKEKEAPKTETHVLELGSKVEKGDGARNARFDKGPGVFTLPGSTVAELAHGYLDFADRTILKLDAAAIRQVNRAMDNVFLEMTKKDNQWQIVKPAPVKADNADVDDFVQRLSGLRAVRVAAYKPADLATFGLATPHATWILRTAPDDKNPVILKVGKVVPREGKPADPDGDRYVMADGGTAVGVLPAALCRRLVGPSLKFHDRNLARFADADRATLERGPRKATFAKVDGTWKMTAPIESEAEQADLDDFLNSVAQLRADELVADKPDLAKYGLDRPELIWTFRLGDKEVLGLTIGALDKDGLRRFAKVKGSDLVFLLSTPMTTQALREYRSRTLWSAFDAAQVDAVKFTYPANPFTLEKVGTFWTAGGKPVQSTKASETLDALSRLKAERFVVDKDADLKLYGLQPPDLSVEVRMRSGSRTLHVGRAEGESKRRYAHVVDGKRTDVFIMSEADAAKIVRDLAFFTKANGRR